MFNQLGKCDVCGAPSLLHITDCSGIENVSHSYCFEHLPEEHRDRILEAMPYGPHRTPAEEVAFLRQQLVEVEQQLANPDYRAEFIAETEQMIADIEAGRRRLGDGE